MRPGSVRASVESDGSVSLTGHAPADLRASQRRLKAFKDVIAVNTTYRLFRVSPLHGLTLTRKAFDELTVGLLNAIRSAIAKVGSASKPYRATKAVFEAPTGSDDLIVIIVSYEKTVHNTVQEAEMRVVLAALAPAGAAASADEAERPAYLVPGASGAGAGLAVGAQLPVLLAKGPVLLVDCICRWLETRFDCSIAPAASSAHELALLAADWCSRLGSAGKPLELSYEMPSSVTGISSLVYSIEATTIAQLRDALDGVADSSSALVDALNEHFRLQFGIQLTGLRLTQVAAPSAMLSAEGRLKFLDEDGIAATLASLRSIVLPQVRA